MIIITIIINFIEKTMEISSVELTAGGRNLAESKIQSGVFQGHALSPLLFVIVMTPFNHILKNTLADTNLINCKKRSINYCT